MTTFIWTLTANLARNVHRFNVRLLLLVLITFLSLHWLYPNQAWSQTKDQKAEAEAEAEAEAVTDNQSDDKTKAVKLHRQAFANFQKGQYLSAFNLALQAVDLGSTKAKLLLAKLYIDGWAVGQDNAKARNLLEKAMREGNAEAAYLLGLERSRRTGDPTSQTEAFEFFTRASQAGHPKARLRLAQFYLDQNSRRFDPKKAAHLLVSLLDTPEAVYELSLLYLDGIGVALDNKRGLRLLKLAASQGVSTAQIQLASLYLSADGVQRDEAKAINWLRLAAQKGNPLAQNQLARAYATATGDNYNAAEAMKWHLISLTVGMSDPYLDSFVASLPEALRQKVSEEVRAMGIMPIN